MDAQLAAACYLVLMDSDEEDEETKKRQWVSPLCTARAEEGSYVRGAFLVIYPKYSPYFKSVMVRWKVRV